MTETIRYRGYEIRPGNTVFAKWEFAHDDYDGAPNEPFGPPADPRCGYGQTVEECKSEIDWIEDDLLQDDVDEELAQRALMEQP